ncbi:CBL-interacting protein kinase 2-like [Bidens hawaiensis]|uniref:CBL-interacting protein kinase 2-like n=1 Tax=Bidens hawaiensis TaxID=980011 RepID=UPI00404B9832
MDTKGVVLMQRYELGKLLGHGNFAKVYHARNLANGTSVAVKVIDKNKVLRTGMMTHIKREISVMRLVKHPNIVRLYEVMATKTKIYFILEYVKGGELFDKLSKGKLKEEAAKIYFRQLISAIGFCHNRGVYHRDLKPENLLLDDEGNLKVSDFGLSALAETKRQDGLLHTCCGSPAYVAPEVINQKGYDGAKADIWSCGVVLFFLLAGFLPFHDSNLIEMYRKIALARFKFPNSFPAAAKSLVFKMLDPNPLTRISIEGIVEHPWFNTGLVETNTVSTSADSVVTSGGSVGCCNAFDIISLSRGLNLSGLFSDNGEDDKEVRFMLKQPGATIVSRLEELATGLKMKVVKKNGGILRMEGLKDLVVDFEVFEIMPNVSLIEVELIASDRVGFREMMSEHVKPVLTSL